MKCVTLKLNFTISSEIDTSRNITQYRKASTLRTRDFREVPNLVAVFPC
jgi:hypothetical protein